MKLRSGGNRIAFEHFLHQVNASARAIEFVAGKLICRAGGETKPAVDTLPQNGIGLDTFGRVLDPISQVGLHIYV